MERVGIIANPDRPIIKSLIPWLLRWLEAKAMKPSLTTGLAGLIDDEQLYDYCRVVETEALTVQEVDWVIAIGGDGTLLKTARLVGGSDIPILGVNTGTLGFMMQTTPDELIVALDHIVQGAYYLDTRLVLQAHVDSGPESERSDGGKTYSALNDIVIDKGAVCRVIEMAILINGEYVNTVIADGLIISTPTGSTAYSLAAGGPIVVPEMEAMIVSPICPHTLSNRAMVLSSHDRVAIEVRADRPELMLTIDGQESVSIQSGDCIELHRAPYTIKLIRYSSRSFYDVLRTKLKWGER